VHNPADLPVQLTPDIRWLSQLDVSTSAVVLAHPAQRKDGAQVFATVGDTPLVVGDDYGAGRVVCVMAAPYGQATSGRPALWDAPDWPYVMRQVLWWAMHNDRNFKEYTP